MKNKLTVRAHQTDLVNAPEHLTKMVVVGLCILLILSTTACNMQRGSGSSNGASETAMQFLEYIPDTPENRQMTSFGDAAAWYTSWDVPRITSIDEWDQLADAPRAYWSGIMLKQVYPPDCLDSTHIMQYSLGDTYGFDLFDLDRFTFAGEPPEVVTVADFRTDRQTIKNALTAQGYTEQEVSDDWTLYSLNDDYAVNLKAETTAGKLGNLNRILLSNQTLIIGKATEVVLPALDAISDNIPSLADDDVYIAATQALQDSSLKDAGELVGVIWMDSQELATIPEKIGNVTSSEIEDLMAQYGLNDDLPHYSLATFGTRHSQKTGVTSLILALVFPRGTDAEAASQALQSRIE